MGPEIDEEVGQPHIRGLALFPIWMFSGTCYIWNVKDYSTVPFPFLCLWLSMV